MPTPSAHCCSGVAARSAWTRSGCAGASLSTHGGLSFMGQALSDGPAGGGWEVSQRVPDATSKYHQGSARGLAAASALRGRSATKTFGQIS